MYIQYDHTAGVYEVIAADGSWMACFDTRSEAADWMDRELRRTHPY